MLDYLKTMPAGTRMAVFGLSTHLFVIQGFTSDPELLKAAITSSEKLMPMYSPLEDIKQDPAQFNDKTLEEQGNNMAERGLITFAAIRQIARYLSGMPGRKNLIWASASFPLQFPPEPRDPDAWPHDFPPMFDYTQDIKSMGDMLARAHIAVYPIEPRGLDRILHPGDRKAAIEFGEHGTMDVVADLTGGHNFHNTNGIGEALAAAIDTGANFYTLTYTPTNQTLDTRFRTIKVTVDQPNLHLVYRDGYYNADGDEIVNSVSKTVNPILPPAVYKSMLTGGANAHLDIDLPTTGNYFLRIAVHDLTTDHVGAIEIPTSSITPNPTPTTTPGK